MKGYKAFNKDLTCRGFQYEIGETYKMNDPISVCNSGFHFCDNVTDCYKIYPMSDETRICEVEALGKIQSNEDKTKYCTNEIKIVCEVTDWTKKANINPSNTGFCNSGDWNSGNCNSGDWNSGDWNSGNCNSGDCNSGDWNSGNWNSGDCNSGDCNSGNRNSGDCNSGNRNSGDWNLSSYNSGCFNTETHKIVMFDQLSEWNYEDWINSAAHRILRNCPQKETIVEWIYEPDMTEKEKFENPTYKTTGGYLKVTESDESKQEWWDKLTPEDKTTVMGIPNFNTEKFYKCTGIKV